MKSKILRRILLLNIGFLISHFLSAQAPGVSGRVSSGEDNQPLIGVTVLVKGTTQGASTDLEGKFTVPAKAGDVLVFSYTGFDAQEIPVKNAAEAITVTLKPSAKMLGEVVVVGYGTQSRETLTNSVAKVDTEVLESVPRANVGSALQGTVSGVQVVNSTGQPGAGPVILLRGGASINSPGAPLVIVDGVVRSLNDIASEDIASIELLKDAASTAIYGARANNGVILITTKQGKSGTAQISYKFTGGYNKGREGYKYLGARDYIYYTRLGYLNAGRTLAQVNSSRGLGMLTDPANLATFDIQKLSGSNRGLLAEGWEVMADPYNTSADSIIFRDHGGEIEDLVFRNTYTRDHYISAVGGNEKGKYFASFDYFDEDGVIVGSSYKRYSGVLNGSYKIRPNVEVSTGVTMSTSSQVGVLGGEANTLYRSLAIWPTFNPWIDAAKTQPNPGNSISDGNPLYWLNRAERNNEVNRITVNGAVNWEILPGFYFKGTGNAYLFENLNQSFQKSTQTYANIFANPPSFNNTSRTSTNGFARDFQQQYNGLLNYVRTIGNKHNVDAMVGAEYFSVRSNDMQVLGQNAPTDDIPTANASTIFAAGSNYSNISEYRILSAFGRFNYDYDQRYLFTAVFRRDAVSSLAQDNRAGFFPGMSAGWNIHREPFFQNLGLQKYVSSLKPRVSYGENGNVAGLGRYEVQGVYGLQGNYNGNAGFLNTEFPNPGLRWEKSKTIDVGADIGFLDNRVSVLFDYFDRRTSDLLTNLTLPSYIGFNTVRTNLGTYQNQGYEFTVSADVLRSPSGVNLTIGGNASYIKNKILQLPFNGNERNRQGGIQVYDPKAGEVVWVGGLQEGGRLGDIYGFRQVSIFKDAEEVAAVAGNRTDAIARITGPGLPVGPNGRITPGDVNWEDVDQNNIIDSRDQVYLGNIFPKWTGGFSTTLSYKNFTLYNRFDFAVGHTIYNDLVARTLGNYQGTFNYIDWQKNAWSPTNTETDIPKVYFADQVAGSKQNYTRANNAGSVLNGNNSRFYEKGNYLASREITLSYDVSKSLLARTKLISQARIYTSLNNLFYVTPFSGPSPEPPAVSGSITGIYTGTYPTPRSAVLGVQVSF
ncbi:SusC/RagA family TonB-linked outer membrane protein [Adhaeribacter aerolatus]|uniref:SusC/RagA family TonB-linked outer membrane protein n=1 Tax=Adhaeribacter aerolatus TaxID=670289 RepID=A0A512AXA2_9BACT|nr:TonB-dependent receptor [Adhaeribacter aerolatus]GEO04351.1 SusC/RagA family TonB-linked outer membrane protein [Adhaeribacter aerolatus]